MDKSWINKPRLSQDYRLGVKRFLDFAFTRSNANMMKCPCNRCLLTKSLSKDDIEGDLMCYGFLSSYTSWILHGEEVCVTGNTRLPSDVNESELDSTLNLLDDIFPDISVNMPGEYGNETTSQPMGADRPSTSSGTFGKGESSVFLSRHYVFSQAGIN